MNNLLEAREISKVFEEGNKLIKAVNKINFQINTNEKIVIYGRSGSGKSTLLNLLSGLDTFSEGQIIYKNLHLYWIINFSKFINVLEIIEDSFATEKTKDESIPKDFIFVLISF